MDPRRVYVGKPGGVVKRVSYTGTAPGGAVRVAVRLPAASASRVCAAAVPGPDTLPNSPPPAAAPAVYSGCDCGPRLAAETGSVSGHLLLLGKESCHRPTAQ